MKDLITAKELLHTEGYTCVLCKGESVLTSTQRGVRPLTVWLGSGRDFQGYCAADKVVGRATAFLYVLMGVKGVYARVISQLALQVLTEHGVAVEYVELTPNVINRRGDGICPFERAVLDVTDPAIAYEAITKKLSEFS